MRATAHRGGARTRPRTGPTEGNAWTGGQRRRRRTAARCCSRSPTGWWRASAMPRTSCRRRSCVTTGCSTTGTAIDSPRAYLSAVRRGSASTTCARRRCGARPMSGNGFRSRCSPTRAARPGRRARAGRLAVHGVPAAAGAAQSGRARRVPAARRLRVRLPGDRRDRRPEPGQLPSAGGARPAARAASTGRGSRPPGQAQELAERFMAALSEGDMDGLVALLAADVVVYGDSGGGTPRGRGRSWAPTRCPACSSGSAGQIRDLGVPLQPREINGQPGALFSTRTGDDQRLRARDHRRCRSRPSGPSSIRTSSATSGPSPTSPGSGGRRKPEVLE